MISRNTKRFAAFTLVELMVAMALIILIMTILAQAFAEGSNLFREAKAIGDMQEKLRVAVVRLRDDLILRHFSGSETLGRSYTNGERPEEGFLRIQQGNPLFPSVNANVPIVEGIDADGVYSYRTVDQILHLSTLVTGDRRENYWTASAPPYVPPMPPPIIPNPCRPLWMEGPIDYRGPISFPAGGTPPSAYFMNSQRAEVMWFLVPQIDLLTGTQMFTGSGATPPLPLYALHRRQRLLATDANGQLNNPMGIRIPSSMLAQFPEIACQDYAGSGFLNFPTFRDLTQPANRTMMNAISLPLFPAGTYSQPQPFPVSAATVGMLGEDRIIADVVSFEIRILVPNDATFRPVKGIPPPVGTTTPPFPDWRGVQDLPLGVTYTNPRDPNFPGTFYFVYDTATWPIGTTTTPPSPTITLRGIQITIRVYDARTDQTRQITLIQDM